MKIKCAHCNHVTEVPDSRLPDGVFKIKCRSCSKLITASKAEQPAEPQEPAAESKPSTEPATSPETATFPDVMSLIQKEISKARSEILESVGAMLRGEHWSAPMSQQTILSRSDAVVCVRDGGRMEELLQAARSMGYNAQGYSSVQQTLEEIQPDATALIIVDDSLSDDQQDARKLISLINGWHGRDRRNALLVLLSAVLNTGDSNQAFLSGVNLIVNENDLSGLKELVEDGKRQFQQLYHIYRRLEERKIENSLKIGD